jgi:AcrR family transcriptional regulator
VTESGLRERKKQRTRDALTDAAFTLFGSKGFEATTIDEIADAVEVSPRTFFRYFASKEEVALSLMDQQLGAILDRFAQRPADEPVLTALRAAAVEVIRSCEDGVGFDPSRFECIQTLLGTSPLLAARSLEQGSARISELAELVAARMGVNALTDQRPYLVASVVICGIQTAVKAWRDVHPDARSSDLINQAFDLLTTGLNYPAAGEAVS